MVLTMTVIEGGEKALLGESPSIKEATFLYQNPWIKWHT